MVSKIEEADTMGCVTTVSVEDAVQNSMQLLAVLVHILDKVGPQLGLKMVEGDTEVDYEHYFNELEKKAKEQAVYTGEDLLLDNQFLSDGDNDFCIFGGS
jgi:hypothetical protein